MERYQGASGAELRLDKSCIVGKLEDTEISNWDGKKDLRYLGYQAKGNGWKNK